MVLGLGRDLHAAEARFGGRLGRVIAQHVLVADILSHLGSDLVDLLDVLGEKRHAAGLGGKHFQSFARVLHLGAAYIISKQQSNRIDDRSGELLNAADGLLQIKS